jgi:hypothetical protein
MEIKRTDTTPNGTRVWVTDDGINCDILEYNHTPEQTEVFADFQKILDSRAADAVRLTELKALKAEEQQLLEELENG